MPCQKKQVPSCEFFRWKPSVLMMGTDNLLRAAMEARVKNAVCLSTDMLIPLMMGNIFKAMMEKVIKANEAEQKGGNNNFVYKIWKRYVFKRIDYSIIY